MSLKSFSRSGSDKIPSLKNVLNSAIDKAPSSKQHDYKIIITCEIYTRFTFVKDTNLGLCQVKSKLG